MLRVKGLDTVAHIVLEHRVSHRHAILAPLQSPLVDGLHRIDGPAGQVSAIKCRWAAIKVTAGSEEGAGRDSWTPLRNQSPGRPAGERYLLS